MQPAAAAYFTWPDEGLEWICYVFVVPVLVLNMSPSGMIWKCVMDPKNWTHS
jgi:hypothetical protein